MRHFRVRGILESEGGEGILKNIVTTQIVEGYSYKAKNKDWRFLFHAIIHRMFLQIRYI